MNNLINVVNNLLQCCAAPCQQLLSTTIVHSCSRSTIIVQSLLTTIKKLFSSTIVSSCSNNIVTTIVLCQHWTTIDRTILINIVNSTSVVEPWKQHCPGVVRRTTLHQPDQFLRVYVATDETYSDVELPLKPLLFYVLISRPYDVCPRAAP